jgi:protein-S-isoprenylcysteine O-methyltransferase Ste14
MTTQPPTLNKIGFIFSIIITMLFFPVIIFLSAGTWRWLEGWLFSLWMVVMVLSNFIYLYLKDPALLAERSRVTGSDNQKAWDRFFLPFAYVMSMVWFVLIPLDAKRFAWSSDFPVWVKVVGGALLVPALYFIYFATAENTFLSTRVRIQADRKQRVISSGVYGFVRHPLYLGVLAMLVGMPLLTGSLIGLAISLVALIALIIRIISEERMLINELEGYPEYTQKVKFRLIPLIW